MERRFLILGGAGFIGSALARQLVEHGDVEVTVLDDLSAGNAERLPSSGRLRFIEGSILEEDDLERAFSCRPDVVLNMAASFANLRSVEHAVPDLRTNTEGTLRALQHATSARVGLFVHASSSCVYGDLPGPLEEKATRLRPFTPYAISKLAAEHYVLFHHRYHGLPATILRYFNCYGPGETPGRYRGVVVNFMDAALRGRPLVITGTGDETRQLLYIQDAVRATLMAVEAGERVHGQVINVASGRDTTIMELARTILDVTSSRSPVQISEARDWDLIPHRSASTTRARQVIGFTASTGLRDGLTMTARHYR